MKSISHIILSHYKLGQIPIIYGQTATGKTRLSLELAKKIRSEYGNDVEIISADSRQVYRKMDIGTDKIGLDIRNQIIHHQIDIIDPDQTYTAGQWQMDTYKIIEDIIGRGNIPMIVGGTGLYVDTIVFNFNMGVCEPDWEYREKLNAKAKANSDMYLRNLLNTIDPVEAAKHHPSSERFIIRALEIYKQTGVPKSELMKKQEPKHPLLLIDLQQDVEMGNKLIDLRLKQMIEQGLLAEVQRLMNQGYHRDLASMKTIDYKQTIEYIMGECDYNAYIQNLQIINHQLAKKQRTRFRRYNKIEESDSIIRLQFYLPDYS